MSDLDLDAIEAACASSVGTYAGPEKPTMLALVAEVRRLRAALEASEEDAR